MNKIRAIQELNKKEIEQGMYVTGPFLALPTPVHLPCSHADNLPTNTPILYNSSPNASWHVDYRDTAFIYFGGLPFELSEGDVITIFSQYGEPVFLKLARDRETGKSRGFGWLKYEDQRSTDLAVDNLGGSTIGGRMVSVDHARYKPRDDDDPEEGKVGWEDVQRREREERGAEGAEDTDVGGASATDTEEEARKRRPMLKEERELQLLIEGHDDDDPMKEFLVEEKKKEVEDALRRERKKLEQGKRHKSHRHRSHRSRRHDSRDDEEPPRHRIRDDDGDADDKRKERSRRDDSPMDVDEDRRERRHRGSREPESRRDHDRRRGDDRDRRRDYDSDRRRPGREDSEEYESRRHRGTDRERRRRQDRSRSP